MVKVDSLNLVCNQYQVLSEKLSTARNTSEVRVLLKRLVNLIAVMEFLISLNKAT